MIWRAVAFLMLGVSLAGCGLIGDLTGFGLTNPAVTARLEVFNRTEDPIYLAAADGERLDVPPCGSAEDANFRVDNVEVRTAEGYIHTFGSGAVEATGDSLFIIETEHSDGSFPMTGEPPSVLPPCTGHPQVQVGA